MKYKIERNIPVPEHTGRGRPPIYPWRNMSVGDSILIEKGACRIAPHQWGRNNGAKFAIRKQADGSLRVWRIS